MTNFFQKLFGTKQQASPQIVENVQTAPLSDDQLQIVTKEATVFHPPQILVGSAQSVGRQREHNEDTLYTLNVMLSGTGNANGIPFGLFIIADGMGGHQHGEVASGAAVRAIASYILRKLYFPFFGLNTESQDDSLQEIMQAGVREAQQAVVRQAPGGGTTLTSAFMLGDQVTVTHVGDSRAYFMYPDGRIQIVTRDHSLVKRLQELGQITEKEAATHPQKNVLYRAIGQGEPFDPDINTFLLPHPGSMMLCSDGLWNVVSEEEIFRIINNAKNPSVACNELVEAANAAGGPDNISVIVVQYPN